MFLIQLLIFPLQKNKKNKHRVNNIKFYAVNYQMHKISFIEWGKILIEKNYLVKEFK